MVTTAEPVSLETIRQLIVQIAPPALAAGEIVASSNLVSDIGLESIDLVGLVFLCEQTFGVNLVAQGELLRNLTTVGRVLDFIAALQAQ